MIDTEARVYVPEANILGLRNNIDSAFDFLMYGKTGAQLFQLDRSSVYSNLADKGLRLPKILTNNPDYHDLKLLIYGKRVLEPEPESPEVMKVVRDTRNITLVSSRDEIDERYPFFVYQVTIGGVPKAYEGFREPEIAIMSPQGLVSRDATLDDLGIASTILQEALRV